jgi:hypothetical protein
VDHLDDRRDRGVLVVSKSSKSGIDAPAIFAGLTNA